MSLSPASVTYSPWGSAILCAARHSAFIPQDMVTLLIINTWVNSTRYALAA